MLKDILQNKKCFKLVCGAGNQDTKEVEKLVAVYAKAGANFFDLSTDIKVVKAAQKGLQRAIPENELQNYFLCVSVGTKDDPHLSKAKIDETKCTKCGNCEKACKRSAVIPEYWVNVRRCIGCGNCKKACPAEAVSFYHQSKPLDEILTPAICQSISCVELHSTGMNEEQLYQKWKTINELFNGILSFSISRSEVGDNRLTGIIRNLTKDREDFSTIIQADGVPMSGNEDDYKTTLQTVAMAQIVQNANLPVFIMLSGGTNSKTAELVKLCNVTAHGVAIGSFARKIVKEYIDRDDFWQNQEIFDEAVKTAQNLVNKTLKDLK